MTDSSQEPMNAASTPTQERSPKKDRSPEYNAILALGALILALTGIFSTQTYWIRADLNAAQTRADADRRAFTDRADADRRAFTDRADADRRAFNDRTDAMRLEIQRQAAADRRAIQAAMDTFRTQILQLTDRQARLEANQEAQASGPSTDS